MQDEVNRKPEKQRNRDGSADGVRPIGDSIRQAFLTHMGEQQRQFAPRLARPAGEAAEARKR
jgi:hypothetical protein